MNIRILSLRSAVSSLLLAALAGTTVAAPAAQADLVLSRADYLDRVHAIWAGQIVAVLTTIRFEHKPASVIPIETLPMQWEGKDVTTVPVDDDWYYEMVAIRAFEKYGTGLTVEQLGEAWREYACGSWGSSEQARFNLQKGLKGADLGHPRYNKLWYSLGPQFSADVYGALAPGLPNVAARMAREFGHINGYAEGTDGAVFVATMISLGFTTQDTKAIVRQAAQVLDASSPFRQAVDQVIALAEQGRSFTEVVDAAEDRWHLEYPATNNAVANGAIIAAGVWFGEGDFWRTMNLIAGAADFTDADCNAANAAAVIGAMHGMKALPAKLVAQLNDRIVGTGMGHVKQFPQPVDESISELAQRTAAVGEKILAAEKVAREGDRFRIPVQKVVTQPAERFVLADLMRYWNPDWKLERAGFGGAGGGMPGIRGITCLEGDILATYPRDEVRGLRIVRQTTLGAHPRLSFEVGADAGRAWDLSVFVNNQRLTREVIESTGTERTWKTIDLDLKAFAGQPVTIRLYQRVLLPDKTAGNALWRNLQLN